MHPTKPNVLYASMWQFRRKAYAFSSGGPGSGLFKSLDAVKLGINFRKVYLLANLVEL
jgi:hypothetical protein